MLTSLSEAMYKSLCEATPLEESFPPLLRMMEFLRSAEIDGVALDEWIKDVRHRWASVRWGAVLALFAHLQLGNFEEQVQELLCQPGFDGTERRALFELWQNLCIQKGMDPRTPEGMQRIMEEIERRGAAASCRRSHLHLQEPPRIKAREDQRAVFSPCASGS